MTSTKLYNSFPRLSHHKKTALVNFICNYQEDTNLTKILITHLVDYALKEISSFGGFVVTEEEGNEILGAMVVNNTGMEGYMPNNLIVASAFLPSRGKQGSKKRILQKIMHVTRGDTALLIQNTQKQEKSLPNLGLKTLKMTA